MRRRQAQETLDFERERERNLEESVELVIGEAEGARIDAAAFARMKPEDAEIVREEFSPVDHDADDPGSFFDRDDVFNFAEVEDTDPRAEELARLNGELEECRRRQQAFSAYIEALGE